MPADLVAKYQAAVGSVIAPVGHSFPTPYSYSGLPHVGLRLSGRLSSDRAGLFGSDVAEKIPSGA